MEINLITFLILALAAYRITRFLIFDTIIGGTRQKIYVALANLGASDNRLVSFIGNKALEGLSCTFCLGAWVSAAVYWLYTAESPVDWGRHGWLLFAGLAGLQSLVHILEPDDEV